MRTLTRIVIALATTAGAIAVPGMASATACAAPTAPTLSQYFDSSISARLADTRVPGAVVTVVSGGKAVFSRGYGLADTAKAVPFDPDRSMVRIASITKLFTWAAVMQQVQAGRLDLDTDVNRYLKGFQIPATYPQPITLRHLMNHTAGFEDRIIGTGAKTAADVAPLAKYLAEQMPARIRPPGQVTAYSNYGAGLAGYIVSQVSGEPYAAYIQRHLLNPLGMNHTTATEPVPAALAGDLARSYNTDENPVYTVPFTFDVMPPDGSISATASDMGRFASAYLSGSLVASEFTARSYATDARLSGGYEYGFEDKLIDGHRVVMHDGSWEAFGSVLAMVPGCDVGLFVSANSTGFVDLLAPVVQGFFDLLPKGSDANPIPQATAALTPGTPVAGFYQPARHSESTVEKILSLLGPARLTIASDGTVQFRGKSYVSAPDGLYTATDGSDHLVFLRSAGGKAYVGTDGPALELLPWWQTPLFGLGLVAAIALIALTAPIAVIRRRSRTAGRTWRLGRWAAAVGSLAGLAFLVLVAVELLYNTRDMLFHIPISFRLVLLLPFLVAVLAFGGAAGTVLGWRDAGVRVAARVHQVTLLAGLGALMWFAMQWNLVGW